MANNYWLLGENDNQSYGEVSGFNEMLDWDLFTRGRTVDTSTVNFVVKFEQRIFRRVSNDDWLPILQPIPIVSLKFGRFLAARCPECVQLLPIRVSVDDTIIDAGQFAILNVICSSRVIDLGVSKFTEVTSKDGERIVTSFSKIAFCEDAKSRPELFREECFRQYVFCGDALAQAIELGKFRIAISDANEGLSG